MLCWLCTAPLGAAGRAARVGDRGRPPRIERDVGPRVRLARDALAPLVARAVGIDGDARAQRGQLARERLELGVDLRRREQQRCARSRAGCGPSRAARARGSRRPRARRAACRRGTPPRSRCRWAGTPRRDRPGATPSSRERMRGAVGLAVELAIAVTPVTAHEREPIRVALEHGVEHLRDRLRAARDLGRTRGRIQSVRGVVEHDRPYTTRPISGESAMKVDGALITNQLADVPARARALEAAGYDGGVSAEISSDPFLPLALAAEHTERLELMTSIAVAFARNPMLLANLGHDLNAYSKGRFILGLGSQIRPHIQKRFSMPWSRPAARMREFILAMRAVWDCWYDGKPLDFRGEFYTHTLMTPMFTPTNTRYGAPRVFLAAVGPGDDRGGRRGGGRHDRARVHDRALRARGDAARARARARARGQAPRRLPDHLPRVRRDGPRRGELRGEPQRGVQADRLLRLDARLSPGARVDRPRRAAGRAQPAVEGGPVGRDGPAHRRRAARRVRGRRRAAPDRRQDRPALRRRLRPRARRGACRAIPTRRRGCASCKRSRCAEARRPARRRLLAARPRRPGRLRPRRPRAKARRATARQIMERVDARDDGDQLDARTSRWC